MILSAGHYVGSKRSGNGEIKVIVLVMFFVGFGSIYLVWI